MVAQIVAQNLSALAQNPMAADHYFNVHIIPKLETDLTRLVSDDPVISEYLDEWRVGYRDTAHRLMTAVKAVAMYHEGVSNLEMEGVLGVYGVHGTNGLVGVSLTATEGTVLVGMREMWEVGEAVMATRVGDVEDVLGNPVFE